MSNEHEKGAEIRIVFDYVDPGSYLAWALLSRWKAASQRPVAIRWAPLELRTPESERLDPNEPGWLELTRSIGEQAIRASLPFAPPPVIPWTRKAHELACHAREKGCFDAVHPTLFEAYFQRGLDIGRVDVLVSLGRECGLEEAETRTVLGVDRFLAEVLAERERLLAEGIRGVPTLELNARRLEGLKGAAEFRRFLNEAGVPF